MRYLFAGHFGGFVPRNICSVGTGSGDAESFENYQDQQKRGGHQPKTGFASSHNQNPPKLPDRGPASMSLQPGSPEWEHETADQLRQEGH